MIPNFIPAQQQPTLGFYYLKTANGCGLYSGNTSGFTLMCSITDQALVEKCIYFWSEFAHPIPRDLYAHLWNR